MVLKKVEEVELFGIRLSGDLAFALNHSRFWGKRKRLSKNARSLVGAMPARFAWETGCSRFGA
jgi:hypothetical protein